MNDRIFSILSMFGLINNEYIQNIDNLEDIEYLMDKQVVDCQLKLYLLMLDNRSEEESNKRFEEFEKIYDILDESKKEFIKNDFKKIIKAQDEHKKKKEKKL